MKFICKRKMFIDLSKLVVAYNLKMKWEVVNNILNQNLTNNELSILSGFSLLSGSLKVANDFN